MGVTKFSGSTGYRGVVKIEKDPDPSQETGSRPARSGAPVENTLAFILATSGNFTMGHNPIFSSGVWGAGFMNASERVAYANDIARLEGSVGLEYTAGDVFDAVRAMCFKFRGDKGGTFLKIFPNGIHGFQGFAWATSLSFSASQGQIITGDFNWTSYLDGVVNKVVVDSDDSDSEVNTPYGASGNNNGAAKPTAPGPFPYNGLYPYWGTDVVAGVPNVSTGAVAWDDAVVPDIISWSANYDSAIEVLKCCGCKDGTYTDTLEDSYAPLAPDYLGLGPMNASCNMEIFKLKNDFSDNSLHDRKAFRFILHTPYDGQYTPMAYASNTYAITLPRVVCNSKASQVQQGTSWITGSYAFEALGDFMGPPLALSKGNPDA